MKKLFYLQIVFFFVSLISVHGQSPYGSDSQLYTSSSFDSKTIDLTKLVGETNGAGMVTNGSFSYTIPIVVAPGTNGITPQVNISYSSMSGNGLLGKGWSFSGPSMIYVGAKSIYYDQEASDIALNTNDAFYLDGNRLITISGVNGSNNTTYGLESEDFSSIKSIGGSGGNPDYFIIERKDGTVLEYGKSSNERFLHNSSGKTLMWYLSRVSYKDGNYISYHYTNSNNEMLLTSIKYTGNTITNMAPYNRVDFIYTNQRVDKRKSYIKGQEMRVQNLLYEIRCYAENSVSRKYRIVYGHDDINSFIKEIIEFGAGGNTQLNSTIFQYGEKDNSIDINEQILGGDGFYRGDFNGDGYSDIVVISKNIVYNQIRTVKSIKIYKGSQNGTYSLFYNSGQIPDVYAHNNERFEERYLQIGDFNGDGYDDILLNQFLYYQNSYGASIVQCKLLKGGRTNMTTAIIPRPEIADSGSTSPDTYYRIEPQIGSGSYCISGDYDGDGALDFITIAKRNQYTSDAHDDRYKVFISYPSKNLFNVPVNVNGWDGYATAEWYERDAYYPMNFNSDSKSELMVVNGNSSKIYTFSFNGTTCDVETLYSAGFPTKWHLILLGDINSDGLTDILSRTSKTNSSAAWHVAYSKGGSFVEELFSFNGGYPTGSNPQNLEVVDIADYNGDGRNEILHIDRFPNSLSFRSYSPTSTGFVYKYTSISDPLCPASQMPNCTNRLESTMSLYSRCDINGDGIQDMGIQSLINRPVDLVFHPNDTSHKLHRIKTGHGRVTKIVYEKMPKTGFYHKNNWNYNYHDVTVRTMPTRLVKDIYTDNGIGGVSQRSYTYEDAYIHRSGKGFLGFGKIKEYNHASNMYSITENKIHNTSAHSLILPYKSYNALSSPSSIKKSTTQNYSIVDKGNRRVFVKLNSSLTNNYLSGTNILNEAVSYDNYGNVTHAKTTVNGGLETTDVYTTYIQKGGPVPAKPHIVTTKKRRQGQAEYQDKVRFLYNAKGQVTYEYQHYGKPKYVRSYYYYKPNGNRYKTSTYIPGEVLKFTRVVFDPKGRYVLESYDALGQRTSKVTRDPKTGNVLTSIALDNQSMTYTYDYFGRKATETYDQLGLTKNYLRQWYQGSDPYVFIEKESMTGSPDVWIYRDILGRERKKAKMGYANAWIYTTKTYDARGRLTSETMPYKNGEAINTHTYGYDAYDRITSQSDVFGTTTVSYAQSAGQLTTTTTDPAGKTQSKVVDAAGREIQSTDNANNTITYTYFSHGKPKEVRHGSTVLNAMQYDTYLNQIQLVDLNAGTTTYTYDGYKRLKSQTNPNGETTSSTYDKLDRMLTSTQPEGTTTFSYYPSGSGASSGKLKEITAFSGVKENYTYDTKGRLLNKRYTVDNIPYNFRYYYDNYNNLVRKQFPSNVNIKYEYDTHGHLKKVRDFNTNAELYRGIHRNGRGQDTYHKLGNGRYSSSYYYHGIPTGKYTAGIQDLKMAWNYSTMNLTSREDRKKSKKEYFIYDDLDRLTKSYGTGIPTIDMNYDATGNITSKTGVGTYSYHTTKKNAVTHVTSNNGSIPLAVQDISYTSFLQPKRLTEGNYQLDYTYAADQQRIKSVLKQNGNLLRTRIYLDEYELNITSSGTEHIHYINVGSGLKAIIKKQGSTKSVYYTYTDHLGTIVTATSSGGLVIAEQNYDAWGKPRNASSWTYANVSSPPSWLYRGYTMHESLPSFRLINMNGRMYDPYVARMLSVDNYAHSGAGLQGYNRYSYALNNPLKYTDPDGEHPILIGAAVGLLTNGISNLINRENFFKGGLEAAFFGALGGGISFSIGEIAGTISNTFGRAGFQFGAHALSGGFISELQGGNFWHGAAAGGLASVTGSLLDNIGLSGNTLQAAQWIGGGLSGGVGSAIAGGNFVDGLRQGLITGGLNHAAHVGASAIEADIHVKATRAFLEDSGYDAAQVAQDVVKQTDGFFGKYYARLNNAESYISDWSRQLDSRTGGYGYVSKSIKGYQVKYYGEGRAHSIGLIRTGIMHYFEAGMEMLDGSVRTITRNNSLFSQLGYQGGLDNTIYDMHGRNSNGYLRIR